MQKDNYVPCSVGILTYNSPYLERCLQSLVDFGEIVVCDGGSSDNTLEIAKKYGCKIINQSQKEKPINDFALERNLTLDASSHDWFFYLDSDEILSPELKKEIREICSKKNIDYYIYKVPYQIISKDLNTKYKSFKAYYQERFFNKKSGAHFIRKIHEKIDYDHNKYKSGILKGCWYVPLDTQLDFKIYKGKVDYRLGILAENWQPKNFFDFLQKAIARPIKNIIKQIIKIIYLRLRYKSKEIIPLNYELFRIYSQLVIIKKFAARYLFF